jgi:hypothetical protein
MVPVTVAATNDATISIPIPSERATVAARCGERSLDLGEGMLRGKIEASDSTSKGPVTISWKTSYARLGGGEAVSAEERRQVKLAADGSFEVCGVPRDATVTIQRAGEATPLATGQFTPGALAASVVVRR